MDEFSLELEWFRCPQEYRIVHSWDSARAAGDKPTSYPNCDWIVPNTDERVPYRPFDKYNALCDVFAAVKTERELLQFISVYGPLTRTSVNWGDEIPFNLRRAARFRELLLSREKGPRRLQAVFKTQLLDIERASWERMGEALPADFDPSGLNQMLGTVELVPDARKGLRARITTDALIGGLWWQLCRRLSGNVAIRECRYCGALFEVGAGTGVRADATFCSNEHSVRFHSLKRSQVT